MRKIVLAVLTLLSAAGIATALYTRKASPADIVDAFPRKK